MRHVAGAALRIFDGIAAVLLHKFRIVHRVTLSAQGHRLDLQQPREITAVKLVAGPAAFVHRFVFVRLRKFFRIVAGPTQVGQRFLK